jgi:hypothetical protein
MKKVLSITLIAIATIIVAHRTSESAAVQCPPLGTFVVKKTIINGVDKHGTQQIVRPATDCAQAHWYRIHVEQGTINIQGVRSSSPQASISAGASIDIPSGNYEMTVEQVGDEDAKGSYEIINPLNH